MQATVTTMNQPDTISKRKKVERARARAIIRFNGLLFHGLGAASFLESAAPLHADRLTHVFAGHPDVGLWLEQIWWPQRAECGRQLRGYIEATWPEFDWSAAYEEFYETYRPRFGGQGPSASLALEALGRCATEAQAAVFYRALANSADEPALRALARQAARDHAGYFDYFRSLFERCERRERIGFAATCRTVLERSRSAREGDVAAAFDPLGRHWYGGQPIPELGYPEFVERMAQFVQRHAALGRLEHLLFRPWLRREPRAPAPQSAGGGAARWLAPAPRLRAA